MSEPKIVIVADSFTLNGGDVSNTHFIGVSGWRRRVAKLLVRKQLKSKPKLQGGGDG